MTSTENSVGMEPKGRNALNKSPKDAAVIGLLERLESQRVVNAWNRPLGPVDKEHFNPDGPEAASVIRSLTAERDALREALDAIASFSDTPGRIFGERFPELAKQLRDHPAPFSSQTLCQFARSALAMKDGRMGECPTCGRPLEHDETTLGGFLRARREERGWSLRHVAKITNDAISCPYLSQIEMGRIQDISARKLMALSHAYAIDPGNLMRLAAGENQ